MSQQREDLSDLGFDYKAGYKRVCDRSIGDQNQSRAALAERDATIADLKADVEHEQPRRFYTAFQAGEPYEVEVDAQGYDVQPDAQREQDIATSIRDTVEWLACHATGMSGVEWCCHSNVLLSGAAALDRLAATPSRDEGKPDYVYDPKNWEFTYPYIDGNCLVEDWPAGEIFEVATLIAGPREFVVTDDVEPKWFKSREEAEAALKSPLTLQAVKEA